MNSLEINQLYKGFLAVAQTAVPYFGKWTYDEPLVFTPATNSLLRKLQGVLFKAITHFANNYWSYESLMPVSPEVRKLLELCKNRPYQPGTYRTDFLIDEDGEVWIIEITCRFPLNGVFISGFFHCIADQYVKSRPHLKKVDDYTPVFDYLLQTWSPFEHICFLKGVEERNESKYAIPIFERGGFKVHQISPSMLPEQLPLLKNAIVFSELNSKELFGLGESVLEELVASNLRNDLRTAFLIHDKRFFTVLANEAFLKAALTGEEIQLLRKHLVPTYSACEPREIWERAALDKDRWVLKERAKGKSIGVYAGCVTSEKDWKELFETGRVREMVLQPYVNQKKFSGKVNGQAYHDYIVGTLMTCDDRFFGPGAVRASSHPVTNVVDDRKIAPLVTQDTQHFPSTIVV